MKILLALKNTLRENYKYFFTMGIIYGFLAILYHLNSEMELFMLIVGLILTFINAILLPNICFKNYYNQTNTNHLASIPFKRTEIFFSQYCLCLVYGIAVALMFMCATELISGTSHEWINFCGAHIVVFGYYFHQSLFAFFICGHYFFQGIVQLLLIFGPMLTCAVFNLLMSSYDTSYVPTVTWETWMKLFPFLGSIEFIEELTPVLPLYKLYFVETICFFILTLWAIRHRPNESVGQGIMFDVLSAIVRFIAIFLASATLFAFFGQILGRDDYIPLYIVCLILCLIVAYIVEMIYMKQTKVLYSFKYGFAVSIVLFGLFIIGISKIERYQPMHYSSIAIEYNQYGDQHKGTCYLKVDDERMQDLSLLNTEFMIADKENESTGHIYFYYFDDHGKKTFARYYPFGENMIHNVLENENYVDEIMDAYLYEEYNLLEIISTHELVSVQIGNLEYKFEDINKGAYLFENYLKQEIENFKLEHESPFGMNHLDEIYITYMVDGEEHTTWYNSKIVYNTIYKTFDIGR